MTPAVLADLVRSAAVDVLTARGLDISVLPDAVTVERPRNPEHGDYATNIAMQVAKKAGVPPRDLAGWLAEELTGREGIAEVDVAGPGFLDLRVAAAAQADAAHGAEGSARWSSRLVTLAIRALHPGEDSLRTNLGVTVGLIRGGSPASTVQQWMQTTESGTSTPPHAETGATETAEHPDTAAPEPPSEDASTPAGDTTGPAAPDPATHAATMLDEALRWWRAGVNPMMVRLDGSKAARGPDREHGRVARFQRDRVTEEEVRDWWRSGYPGLSVVTGTISGNLEMFEFEGRAVNEGLWEPLRAELARRGHPDLLSRLGDGFAERSPSGGWKTMYRVDGEMLRSTKLAQRLAHDDELNDDERAHRENGQFVVRTLLETRGEPGFNIIAPTSGRAHPSGQPWERLSGGPETLVTITAAERDVLHAAARTLDQMPQPARAPEPRPQPAISQWQGERVGDDYNQRADWLRDVLPDWTVVRNSPDGSLMLAHPGKRNSRHQSAQLSADRTTITMYSTDGPLPPGTYDKFGAYAALYHGYHRPDYSAARRALQQQGYGPAPRHEVSRPRPKRSSTPVIHHSKQHGTMIYGTQAEQHISARLRAAHLDPAQPPVGSWAWNPDHTGPDGRPGVWQLRNIDTVGHLATPAALRIMAACHHALSAGGLDVRVELAPEDTTPEARALLTAPSATAPAAAAPEAPEAEQEEEGPGPGPPARPLTGTEQALWQPVEAAEFADDPAGHTSVRLGAIGPRWVLSARTTLAGHQLELTTSFSEHGRAADVAAHLAGRPDLFLRLACQTVTLGQAHAYLDGYPIPPGWSTEDMNAVLAAAPEPATARHRAHAAAHLASPAPSATAAPSSTPPRTAPHPPAPHPQAGHPQPVPR